MLVLYFVYRVAQKNEPIFYPFKINILRPYDFTIFALVDIGGNYAYSGE